MPQPGYARVPYPWRATIDRGHPAPARFYAGLVKQAFRYGSPARRRLGPLAAAAARAGLPPRRLIERASRFGSTERPDLDRLKEQLTALWATLREAGPRLPDDAPPLSVVELQRASARTVLVFGTTPQPLLVVKFAHPGERVLNEVAALQRADGRIAPRYLGRVADGHVQEGIPGEALRVDPVTPSSAANASWSPAHEALGRGLVELAGATALRQRPAELGGGFVEAADHAALTPDARRRAAQAVRSLERFERAVLKHGDTSPQNCLFVGDSLQGLVDWETARLAGAPGFDVMNNALALLEHGIGLTRWNDERLTAAFEAAWLRAPLFHHARSMTMQAAEAAGAGEGEQEALVVAFFVRRLAHRLEHPHMFATGPAVARRMLETVCGS